jgi:hypothetical protein
MRSTRFVTPECPPRSLALRQRAGAPICTKMSCGLRIAAMNDFELYLLNALRAIASYGNEGKVVLRP